MRRSRPPSRLVRGVLLGAALAFVLARPGGADSDDDRRLRIGSRVFRSLVAADVEIHRKADAQGRLVLAVFGPAGERWTREAAAQIARGEGSEGSEIKSLEVVVGTTTDASFGDLEQPPAAIFIAAALDDAELARIVRYGVDHHVIVYSPFEGDVERGVLGGLVVEVRVWPVINMRTLKESRITLKPFFLRASKVVG